MSTPHYVGVAVPFTIEEVERLGMLARAEGSSIAEIIRSRIFGPAESLPEAFSPDDEDLTTLMARIEGFRILSRGRRRD